MTKEELRLVVSDLIDYLGDAEMFYDLEVLRRKEVEERLNALKEKLADLIKG